MASQELAHFVTLPRRQQHAIPCLVAAPTIRDAAEQAGVTQRTLFRWLEQPQFQVAYREARYLAMSEAFTLLQKACTRAAQTLLDLMEDREASHFVRLQAAQAVLDTALKSRTVEEVEARLEALEQQADSRAPSEAA